jgi:hypothetical protein
VKRSRNAPLPYPAAYSFGTNKTKQRRHESLIWCVSRLLAWIFGSHSPRWLRTPTTNKTSMSKDGCQKMESPTDCQYFDNHFSTAFSATTVGCAKRTRNAPSPLSHCVLTRRQYPPHRPLAPSPSMLMRCRVFRHALGQSCHAPLIVLLELPYQVHPNRSIDP